MKKQVQALFGVMYREFGKIQHRWPFAFITFLGPLLAFYLVMWTFSANVPRDLPVAVVDLDHTFLSRQLKRMVDATPVARVDQQYSSLLDARTALEEGKIEAILVIPDGTERGILKGRSSSTALYINNANVLKGGLITSGLSRALATASAGIKVQMRMKQGLNTTTAIERSVPVMLQTEVLFNPYINYSYFLTSSLLPVMLIVFTLLGSIYTLGSELKNGTGPELLKLANQNILIALMGKMLPYTALYFSMAMVMNHILFVFLGVPVKGTLTVLLLGELLMILSYQFLAVFLVGLTYNLRLSLSVGSAYTMMALTFSGLTYPVFGMPAIAQAFAHIFPFTYWLKIFIGQALRGEPAANAIFPMYAFWLFIFLGALFIPRVRYLLLNEKYWGKV